MAYYVLDDFLKVVLKYTKVNTAHLSLCFRFLCY